MTLIALLLALPQAGVAIDRNVKVVSIDWLGQKREVHRTETVHVQGDRVSIVDHTFGERLVILPARKTVWRIDPLSGHYSEVTFDDLTSVRSRVLDGIRDAMKRVSGTPEEKELQSVLEGYDRYAADPKAELRADGNRREVIVNGNRVKLSVEVDPKHTSGTGPLKALSAIGAFHPAVVAKFGGLGGLPMKGTVRYVLFLDRVIERFEVTAVRPGKADAAAFALPEGLKKVPLARFGPKPGRKIAKPKDFERSFREDELERKSRRFTQEPNDP